MATWLNDLRYAVRTLSKSKGFSVAAVTTLALAIGANTAIFSVARAVLLEPLPYSNASQLFVIWEDATHIGFPTNTPAPGNYADWKAQNTVFDGMAALRNRSYSLTGAGEPERLQGRQVTHDFFAVLNVPPLLGRTFTEEEDRPGASSVAVISAGLWQTRFGAAPDVIGRTVLLDDAPHTIVGVMPPGFDYPEKGTQVWTPIAFSSEELHNRGSHVLQVVARIKPGVTLERAQEEMDAIAARLAADHPETNANVGVRVTPLRDNLIGDAGRAVGLLLAVAGCVLLIASANLANLLLGRALSRRREMGVRIALGAGRARLVRQLLTEGFVLSAAGVVLGTALAQYAFEFLSVLIPENLTSARLSLDGGVLLFAFALGVLTTLMFGAAPAWRAWRLGVVEALCGGARSGDERSTLRLRNWLVISQTVFTFVLLVASGLVLRTFIQLRAIDPGFRGENVLTMRVRLPLPRYRGVAPRSAFYSQVLDRVRALPGVMDAGFTSWLPYTNWGGASTFEIEGKPAPQPGQEYDANVRLVTPGYLPAMGMTLIKGRFLSEADHGSTEAAAVINQTMARRFWPAEDPLHHRVRICRDCPWVRIVGVAADIHQLALDVEVRPEYFVPFDQLPQALSWAPPQDLAVRVSGDALALAPAVRNAIWTVDSQQPIAQIKVLGQYLEEDLAPRRFQTQLIGGFALLALLLASLGIYGVLSYTVSQRRREIGVRMALGADPRAVVRMVTGRGVGATLIGLVIGLAAAYSLAPMISPLLYGVTPRDPVTFGVAAAALLGTAFFASWIPARRAGRVDPATVLHYE